MPETRRLRGRTCPRRDVGQGVGDHASLARSDCFHCRVFTQQAGLGSFGVLSQEFSQFRHFPKNLAHECLSCASLRKVNELGYERTDLIAGETAAAERSE